ncbi:helix-turn-helix transcriptional regulator [Amycolatopsis sp. NPDC049688]|uniref:helix-turn-helix domain-containing protein n=1 Tax=Amycolatopsis sp. NPDC049688 TaxID=3154733 RepID=UPI003437B78B
MGSRLPGNDLWFPFEGAAVVTAGAALFAGSVGRGAGAGGKRSGCKLNVTPATSCALRVMHGLAGSFGKGSAMTTPQGHDPGSTLPERLNYAIRASGLTDQQILDRIEAEGGHLSRNALYQLKTGKSQNPTLETIGSLAKVLNVAVAFLTDFGPRSEAAAAVEDAETRAALKLLREDAGVKEVLFRMGQMDPDARSVLASMSEQLVALNRKHKAREKPEQE